MNAHPILWRTLGTVGFGLALVALAGTWRLASGPVDISFALPTINQHLPNEPVGIEAQGLQLQWFGGGYPIELVLRDVSIAQPDGEMLALLPKVAVDVSFTRLLRGRIAAAKCGGRGCLRCGHLNRSGGY